MCPKMRKGVQNKKKITSLNHKTKKNKIHRMEMRSCIYQSMCNCIFFRVYTYAKPSKHEKPLSKI